MRRQILLATTIIASLSSLTQAFTITPTFLNNTAQTWTMSEEAVVTQAISDWTSLLSYSGTNQNINMTFQFTAAGTSNYLGLWQGSYSATTGSSLVPSSPAVTHVVNVNTDLMTARSSTFPDNITLAFLPTSTTPSGTQWDALSVLRHELGHALGFTTLYTDSVGNATAGDKWSDHITVSGTSATFDATPGGLNVALASSTNTAHVADPNDLMSVSLLNGVRKSIGFTDLEMLSLAYGYNVTIPAGTSYSSSTFKTQTIAINGTVSVMSTTAARNGAGVVLQSQNLTVGSGGLLDLSNHDLIIRGGQTLANIRSLVNSGFGTGTWNGTHGITSSTANAAGATFGYATAGSLSLTTFDGLPVSSTDIVVKYTFLGDANLDGTVDLTDLNTVLNNLGATNSNWVAGNFDGAATIDLNDLNDVLNHLGVTVPSGASSVAVAQALLANVAAVPEPASLSLLGLAVPLLLRRRKR